jgi:Holliday junction resolvasome RuvABC DNA-binding subunit
MNKLFKDLGFTKDQTDELIKKIDILSKDFDKIESADASEALKKAIKGAKL